MASTRRKTPGAGAARGVVLAALAAAWPTAASAYRPFDSTDAAVTEKGEVEIELGPLGYRRDGVESDLVAPGLIVNWGFADGWEAVLEGRHLVELGRASPGPRERVEDAAISLKHVLRDGRLQGATGASLATELSALLPGWHGEPRLGTEWALVASERWTDVTVHLNGAAAWTRAHAPALVGGIILEGHDAWTVRPVVEALVERERGSPTTVSALAGAIWRVSERLAIDAGVRRAHAGAASATEVRAGLTWGFGIGSPR